MAHHSENQAQLLTPLGNRLPADSRQRQFQLYRWGRYAWNYLNFELEQDLRNMSLKTLFKRSGNS
ncbi:hypothetical protein NIES25_01840 [Nostoc linckia NIES-25]|nr:hypothetical protein NIES25_01840 [Nostoc linckia NIES-25]